VVAERAIGGWLAAAVLISAWAVDPGALGAFDAPKRAGVLACIAIAAAVAAWRTRRPDPRAWSRPAQVAVAASAVAALGVALSTWFSPSPEVARDAARGLALWALLLPLGACLTHRLDRGLPGAAFALAIGSSAALSLLQAAGFTLGLELSHLTGRYPTGALLGNEGYVALACALALPGCVQALLEPGARRTRIAAAALALLCVAAIVVNRQLTAALAAVAGTAVVVALHWRARRVVLGALVVGTVVALTALVPTLRSLTWEPALSSRVAELQQLTTYRLGAWAAAESMWRERPLLGHGPGTYATQSLPHRLQAELALHERLTPPVTATHFLQAHDDYLQFAAEAGVPALAALLVALAVVVLGLLPRTAGVPEARSLAGLLGAGAVAALAWFPLQIPLSALLLLLAAGRAWRLVAERER